MTHYSLAITGYPVLITHCSVLITQCSVPIPREHIQFLLTTEGPDKDPTWLWALPNEALRLAMKRCLDLSQGY